MRPRPVVVVGGPMIVPMRRRRFCGLFCEAIASALTSRADASRRTAVQLYWRLVYRLDNEGLRIAGRHGRPCVISGWAHLWLLSRVSDL
jgi:hypothetical protein